MLFSVTVNLLKTLSKLSEFSDDNLALTLNLFDKLNLYSSWTLRIIIFQIKKVADNKHKT